MNGATRAGRPTGRMQSVPQYAHRSGWAQDGLPKNSEPANAQIRDGFLWDPDWVFA